MALSSTSQPKGVVVSVPVLVLSVSTAAIFLFFLLSSLSSSTPPPCSCPNIPRSSAGDSRTNPVGSLGRISATNEDIEWVKRQMEDNELHMAENVLRKGINPRTREQQLQDLLQYVSFFSNYVFYDSVLSNFAVLLYIFLWDLLFLFFSCGF